MGEAEEGSQGEVQTVQERHEDNTGGTWAPSLGEDTEADTPSTMDHPAAISPKRPDLELGEGDGFILI